MTSGQLVGLIGSIAGCVLGILGGIIGTWAGIKNTNGPRERRFMIQASIAMWIGITLFLAFLFVLPWRYSWLMWIPYSILLPWSIIYTNKKQKYLREQELSEV